MTAEGEPEIYRVPVSLKPKSRDDGSQRLYYLTAAVSLLCAQTLTNNLATLRSGNFGGAVADMARMPVEHEKFTSAIKHLSCMVLYLMALEQGLAGPMPTWLSDFLASCVRALDRVLDGDPVQDTMKRYAETDGVQVYDVTPVLIFRDLGFAGMEEHAASPLREFLLESRIYRAEMLRFALESKREDLDKAIQALVPSNDLVIEGM